MLPQKRNVAVLVGNGLSIAFNPKLNLREITSEMMARIAAATDEGDDVVAAMKEIAGLTQPQNGDLRDAIQRVATFAEQVRDAGLSHVLQVIFENSHAYYDDADHLHAFVDAVTTDFDGRVTLANLNYDTLLLSAVLTVCDLREVADLGHGYKKVSIVDDEGNKVAEVPTLRTSKTDFADKHRVRLIHLHGSITYWAGKNGTVFAKLSREHLEDLEQWEAVRDGTTELRPVVVLANQRDKTAHVEEFPFNVAYDVFVDALADSDHWLIVGYSFRDDPVNAKLQAEFNDRAREEKPRVLVVTYGDELTVNHIERAFGWGKEDGASVDWLTVVRTGANGVEDTDAWTEFIS